MVLAEIIGLLASVKELAPLIQYLREQDLTDIYIAGFDRQLKSGNLRFLPKEYVFDGEAFRAKLSSHGINLAHLPIEAERLTGTIGKEIVEILSDSVVLSGTEFDKSNLIMLVRAGHEQYTREAFSLHPHAAIRLGLQDISKIIENIPRQVVELSRQREIISLLNLLLKATYSEVYEGVTVAQLLMACQAQVTTVLHTMRYKYDHNLYVNRTIEEDLIKFFNTPLEDNTPNCYLIVAPAGSGKTNLLCDLARERVSQQPVVLLLGGSTYLGGTTGLFGAIQAELQAASPEIIFRAAEHSLPTLHSSAEAVGQTALILLDAINEHDQPVQMRKAVEDLLSKTRGKRIKLVITCRDYYWGLFKGVFWQGAAFNGLPADDEERETDQDFSKFSVTEHEQALCLYLRHYQIRGRPVGHAAEQCRHPLLLRFFCEAYRGLEIGEAEDIRLKELFDHYWVHKLTAIAERRAIDVERHQKVLVAEVEDYLLNVASTGGLKKDKR